VHNLLGFSSFLAFGAAGVVYNVWQLKSGETLQWTWSLKQITREHYPILYWGNVLGCGLASFFALVFGLIGFAAYILR
jgi:hypothetical protein